MSLAGTDWLFTLGAALLAAAGVALLVWALWGDWLRGVRLHRRTGTRRRRCPRCWYDMAGVQGLRCPECGRDALRESRMHRARRRWNVVAISCAVLVGAHLVRQTPAMRQRGWPAAAPTTLLIAGLRYWEMPVGNERLLGPNRASVGYRKALARELMSHRLRNNMLRDWHWQRIERDALALGVGDGRIDLGQTPDPQRLYYVAVLYGQEKSRISQATVEEIFRRVVRRAINTRERWPIGVPVEARFTDYGWDLLGPRLGSIHLNSPLDPQTLTTWQNGRNDGTVRLGVPEDGHQTVRVVFRAMDTSLTFWLQRLGILERENPPEAIVMPSDRLVAEATVELAITAVGTVDDILTPSSNPAFEEVLKAYGAPRLFGYRKWGPSACLEMLEVHFFDSLSKSGGWQVVHDAIGTVEGGAAGMRAEILRDGQVVGVGDACWMSSAHTDFEFRNGRAPAVISIRPLSDAIFDDSPACWALRLVGDPIVALRDFKASRYWASEIVMPMNAPTINPN